MTDNSNLYSTADSPPDLEASVTRMHAVAIAMGRIAPMRDPIADAIALDLSAAQIHVLMRLGHDGALTMGLLASRIGVTLPACTRLMDRMIEGGLVHRDRDPSDRRVVQVQLTDEGARLFQVIDDSMRDKLGALLSLLEPADRQDFVAILEKLLGAITERVSARAASAPDPDSK